MATGIFDPVVAQGRKAGRRRVPTRPSPTPHPVIGKVAVAIAVAGLVAVVVLGVGTESGAQLGVPGGPATFAGSMTGLVGMYLALVQVLLVARIRALERILGQDGLVRWHRRLGPWPITLLVVHAVVVTVGFAQSAKTGAWHEVGTLLRSYPDMLAAAVGLALMVVAGVASIRALRSRMSRETWWVIHLYLYLALALSFAHVLALGPAFVGHPLARTVWAVVWAATAGVVLVFRVFVPLARSLRHRLRVEEVHAEGPGAVSVVCSGRAIERLALSGGQYFCWRFLTRGLWWQAHPYSVSAMPRPPYLRLTVKTVGDHSAAVARLRPGTRVAIEGPYGAVTRHALQRERVLLVAAGIGVTALRALLEDLPRGTNPIVVLRAATTGDLTLRDEMAELVRQRKGELHEVVGPRGSVGQSRSMLRRLVPDLANRDVYVCGAPGFVQDVVAAAHALGVPRSAIHYEIFSW